MSEERPPTRGTPRMRGYGYIDLAAAIGTPTVEVYCQEDSHAESPFHFPAFGKLDGAWVAIPPTAQSERLRSADDFMAAIDARSKKRVSLPTDADVDLSYNLECRECKLRVRITAAKLHTICEALLNAGVSSITLSALAARLRRGMPR